MYCVTWEILHEKKAFAFILKFIYLLFYLSCSKDLNANNYFFVPRVPSPSACHMQFFLSCASCYNSSFTIFKQYCMYSIYFSFWKLSNTIKSSIQRKFCMQSTKISTISEMLATQLNLVQISVWIHIHKRIGG